MGRSERPVGDNYATNCFGRYRRISFLADRLVRKREGPFGDLAGVRRHRLKCDQGDDRPAGRISDGLENISFHDVGQEYATKRLHMSSATERFRKYFFLILENRNTG